MTRLRWGTGAALSALMAASFFLVAAQIVSLAFGPEPPGAGDAAPAFGGPTVRGGEVDHRALRGQVVLLDFWATWCPPCVRSLPHLEALHRRYADQGFQVIGMNQEPGQRSRVRRFLEARNIGFPSVVDEAGAIAARYGVHTFPTSFLLDRDGRVITSYRGVPSFERVERAVQDALRRPH